MVEIYGTIGPACANIDTLITMIREGMTGIRLNTSHISVKEALPQILLIQEAANICGRQVKILIDMQGPEVRVGKLNGKVALNNGELVVLKAIGDSEKGIPVSQAFLDVLEAGMEVLLDDGKMLLEMVDGRAALVRRGGLLSGGKSAAIVGVDVKLPAMTAQDRENIKDAVKYGIAGVMQPFVRDANDLREVRNALNEAGGENISLLAKIENMSGVRNLESFFGIADEIVIARGDLGNAMPLWELPRVQKDIEKRCKAADVPFMVVTQMLASMEHNAVPTRAEVSDIYNAVCDGAASVMVTGETAVGKYPVEVIRYLSRTANGVV